MSLKRQIGVVLLSYLTRTGFRWAIVSGLSGFALMLIAVGWKSVLHVSHLEENPFGFLIMSGMQVIGVSLLAALIVFFAHARQQLMEPATRFVPNTRPANLIVAAGLFFAIVLAISSPGYEDGMFYPGVLLCVLLPMTLIACAVCNPWLIPLPVTALLLLSYNTQTQIVANYITQEWNLAMFPNETPRSLAYLTEHLHYIWALRGLLLLLDILALIVLERVSRPRRPGASLMHQVRKLSAIFDRSSRAVPQRRRPFLTTRFARIMHRRLGIHDWRAAVFLAGVMSSLAALLCYAANPISSPLVPIVAMLAVLPGTLAAIGWRDRWGSYEFETLYPAKHQQFVAEMLIVLLLDMLEYWSAGLAAMLLAILVMRPPLLHESELWTAISGAAMMQILWVGGIVLAGQPRRTLTFAVGLGILVLAMLLAFDNLNRAESLRYRSHFVAISTIEMLVGLLFLTAAMFAWRRRTTV